jgi:hypothetical protein
MKPRPLVLLAAAGRHGPALLFGGVLVGLLAPELADLAYPVMGIACSCSHSVLS